MSLSLNISLLCALSQRRKGSWTLFIDPRSACTITRHCTRRCAALASARTSTFGLFHLDPAGRPLAQTSSPLLRPPFPPPSLSALHCTIRPSITLIAILSSGPHTHPSTPTHTALRAEVRRSAATPSRRITTLPLPSFHFFSSRWRLPTPVLSARFRGRLASRRATSPLLFHYHPTSSSSCRAPPPPAPVWPRATARPSHRSGAPHLRSSPN